MLLYWLGFACNDNLFNAATRRFIVKGSILIDWVPFQDSVIYNTKVSEHGVTCVRVDNFACFCKFCQFLPNTFDL